MKIVKKNMDISDRILRKMIELDLSQTTLAKMLNVSKGAVNHWTSGRTVPKNQNLLDVAEALEVSPKWLLTGKDLVENKQMFDIDTIKKAATLIRYNERTSKYKLSEDEFANNLIAVCSRLEKSKPYSDLMKPKPLDAELMKHAAIYAQKEYPTFIAKYGIKMTDKAKDDAFAAMVDEAYKNLSETGIAKIGDLKAYSNTKK